MHEFASAYLDDIVIFSKTWEEHIQQLTTVLSRLANAGLTLKPAKYQFGMAECTYLGYRISSVRGRLRVVAAL